MRVFARAIVLVGFLLSSCSGGSALPPASSQVPSRAAAASARKSGKASFVILVPRKHKHRRSGKYVSAATKSLSIVITSGSSTVVNTNVDLTPRSPNCSSTPSGTVCAFAFSFLLGSYVATVSTYDGLEARGNLLSSAQKVAFDVTPATTQIDLTLDGIPHSIGVAAGSYAILGTQASGFTLHGAGAQLLTVNAYDAGGYAIIGAGAPTFSATVKSGADWATSPSGTSGFSIAPPVVNGAAASLQFIATFADTTVCAETDAVCSATIAITNHLQRLFVANGDSTVAQTGYVTIYDPPYTGTPLTVTSGTSEPQVVLLDSSQNLFVGQCDAYCGHMAPDRVEEYAPPYTAAPVATITNGVGEMLGMTMDASQNLFVSFYALGKVGIYAPPYTGTPTVLSGLTHPSGLLVAPDGTLFAANSSIPQVNQYASPYPNTPVAITNGISNPQAFAMDSAKNLYVANYTNQNVTVYAPPYSRAPSLTISTPYAPGMLAFDAHANLFVNTALGNTVYVYAPPYTGTPVAISTNIYFPLAIAIDDVGNLFVANSNNNSIAEFAPPYTDPPLLIKAGAKVPQSLALTP